MRIKKAIFPVAGLGVRFLPITKVVPKEMLPIVDKPLIHYVVEEAIAAGVTELIFITRDANSPIKDYFGCNLELESHLQAQQKHELLNLAHDAKLKDISYIYVQQPKPLGLGHAILMAKNLIGNEPFAVLLADDLIDNCSGEGCLAQMIKQYDIMQPSIVAVKKVDLSESKYYGMITTNKPFSKIGEIKNITEKPSALEAPSDFSVTGRYILTPRIFSFLENVCLDLRAEVQLTDSISQLCLHEKVYAYEFDGDRYDCGRKLGYLHALVAYGLKNCEISRDFEKILNSYQSVAK